MSKVKKTFSDDEFQNIQTAKRNQNEGSATGDIEWIKEIKHKRKLFIKTRREQAKIEVRNTVEDVLNDGQTIVSFRQDGLCDLDQHKGEAND